MIDALGLLIREGFGLVIASLIPLMCVAAVVAIALGLLAGALGIRDGALAQIVRALAIVLTLGAVIEGIAATTVAFAARTWAGLDGSLPAEPEP